MRSKRVRKREIKKLEAIIIIKTGGTAGKDAARGRGVC
jgi:hypothetical protein